MISNTTFYKILCLKLLRLQALLLAGQAFHLGGATERRAGKDGENATSLYYSSSVHVTSSGVSSWVLTVSRALATSLIISQMDRK